MDKYQIIVADPCWDFSDQLKHSSTKRGAKSNYDTLSLDVIKSLKIKEIADPKGSVLALWVPSSLLNHGLEVMKAWGYDFKQIYVWVKCKKKPIEKLKKKILKELKSSKASKKELLEKISQMMDEEDILNDSLGFGLGRLFRQTHEIALIGINNTAIYKKLKNKSQRSVSMYMNEKHSKKPEMLQDSLELMFPGSVLEKMNKIEIFARRRREGWETLGNEIDGLDIRDALQKIIDS